MRPGNNGRLKNLDNRPGILGSPECATLPEGSKIIAIFVM